MDALGTEDDDRYTLLMAWQSTLQTRTGGDKGQQHVQHVQRIRGTMRLQVAH